jgi:hypothetical protein
MDVEASTGHRTVRHIVGGILKVSARPHTDVSCKKFARAGAQKVGHADDCEIEL